MKEKQRLLMFRARQSAFDMAWRTPSKSIPSFGLFTLSQPGDTKDIEKLARSLAGKKSKRK